MHLLAVDVSPPLRSSNVHVPRQPSVHVRPRVPVASPPVARVEARPTPARARAPSWRSAILADCDLAVRRELGSEHFSARRRRTSSFLLASARSAHLARCWHHACRLAGLHEKESSMQTNRFTKMGRGGAALLLPAACSGDADSWIKKVRSGFSDYPRRVILWRRVRRRS